MHRIFCGLGLAAFLAADIAGAEIYRWTDAAGRLHFTEDLSQVPPQYRPGALASSEAQTELSPVQTFSTPGNPAAPSPTRTSPSRARSKVYRIGVQRAGTSMMVSARINESVNVPFVLDTGASDVLIPQSYADQLGIRVGPDTRTKRYSTANGVVTHPVVMLRSVSLGGATVENVPASITPSMQVGLLGLSFFNHFTYNINAAEGVVTLVPNELAESGRIRGGRSEAQWRAEYRNLGHRIAAVEREYEGKLESRGRERSRLETELEDLKRQMAILETEADRARVPMIWRD